MGEEGLRIILKHHEELGGEGLRRKGLKEGEGQKRKAGRKTLLNQHKVSRLFLLFPLCSLV